MNENRPCIPLYTDLTEKKVLVAGTGRAAEDMARYLSGYTDHLFLLTGREPVRRTEAALPEEAGYPYCAAVLCKKYERSDLYGMDYVVSVMEDREVNEDIYVTCRTLGIRVHIAGDPGRCDFFLRLK